MLFSLIHFCGFFCLFSLVESLCWWTPDFRMLEMFDISIPISYHLSLIISLHFSLGKSPKESLPLILDGSAYHFHSYLKNRFKTGASLNLICWWLNPLNPNYWCRNSFWIPTLHPMASPLSPCQVSLSWCRRLAGTAPLGSNSMTVPPETVPCSVGKGPPLDS